MTPIFKSRNALRTVSILLGLALAGLLLGCQATQRGVYRTRFEANQRCLVVEVLDDDLVYFELADTGQRAVPQELTSKGLSADGQAAAAPDTAPAISRCHTGAGAQDADANKSSRSAGNASKAIYSTPMVFKTDYCGPTKIKIVGGGVIETSDMRVAVDPKTLAVTITDITRQPPVELISWRPAPADGGAGAGGRGATGLCIDPKQARYAYGLGEQFGPAGKMDGDWVERGQRTPGCEFGNALVEYEGNAGHVGNAQFPVLYALAESGANYAMFFDGLYPQTWGFAAKEWNITTPAQPLRWYVMTGRDLPDLRKDYMELVGRPPVPPKKAFGLWVSEYGFDNWAELEDKLTTLRANAFPVDGFVLDLQWFGGVQGKSPLSRMGSLDWDEKNFPEPGRKIAELREKFGVGIIPIEESYVSEGLSEFAAMQERGYLAKKTLDGEPTILPAWWGLGGMVDWTNPAAGDYWHDLQRMPLIRDGVSGHWTDLGEPERYDPKAWYYGFPAQGPSGGETAGSAEAAGKDSRGSGCEKGFSHQGLHEHRDVANAYNFRWAESIARGYERNGVKRRPFILSRSGTSGIQRFGAGMWSGDIGSRLGQLAAHMNVQMQMSFSGVDYFGADIGGFNRTSLDGDMNELYTQWFADGAAIDVPVRPHTANTENKYQTAPDRVGDMASNLANIRQRYELTPYLYSLAHRAFLYGEPVVPPLVMYYQDDPETRRLGSEKLLGWDLLVAVAAKYGQKKVDVYLPVGGWVNYHTNEYVESRGQWVREMPLYVDGRFRLPMFARAGAIIPQMYVDEETMNVLGQRADGTRRDELIARVYPGAAPSSFTVYEDDGESIAYKSGAVRTTVISQECKGDQVIVKIAAASGTYEGAPVQRDNVVKLVIGREKLPLSRDASVQAVQVNGSPLPRMVNRESFEAMERAWYDAGGGVVVAKSGEMDVGKEKVFVFEGK